MDKYNTISSLTVLRAKQITHKYITEVIHERGFSNYALAKIAGLNRQIIDSYMKDPAYNLTLESYFRICGALQLHPYLIPAEQDQSHFNTEDFS